MKEGRKKMNTLTKLRGVLKLPFVFLVELWAHAINFSFPEKYSWRQKLRMLCRRYETKTTQVMRGIARPNAVVLDIGAHIGYFSRMLCLQKVRVYAFEPDKENFALLKKNTDAPAFKMAISDHDGTVDFYHLPKKTGTHTTMPTNKAEKRTVPCCTVDSFVKDHRLRVAGIKIDIEGGELTALMGMQDTLTNVEWVISEVNKKIIKKAGSSEEEYIDIFKKKGFAVKELDVYPHYKNLLFYRP